MLRGRSSPNLHPRAPVRLEEPTIAVTTIAAPEWWGEHHLVVGVVFELDRDAAARRG